MSFIKKNFLSSLSAIAIVQFFCFSGQIEAQSIYDFGRPVEPDGPTSVLLVLEDSSLEAKLQAEIIFDEETGLNTEQIAHFAGNPRRVVFQYDEQGSIRSGIYFDLDTGDEVIRFTNTNTNYGYEEIFESKLNSVWKRKSVQKHLLRDRVEVGKIIESLGGGSMDSVLFLSTTHDENGGKRVDFYKIDIDKYDADFLADGFTDAELKAHLVSIGDLVAFETWTYESDEDGKPEYLVVQAMTPGEATPRWSRRFKIAPETQVVLEEEVVFSNSGNSQRREETFRYVYIYKNQ